MGITIYGCEQDEAVLFREMAPRFGVKPAITDEPVSEANVDLASGNRCISVGHKTRITNATLRALSRAGVVYISTRSIGFNHIDVTYAESVGISVGNVAYSPDSVADYTLMLMLMAIRNAKSIIRRADVHDYRLNDVRGKELRDLTVGVIGTGRIGAAVMDRLRGFGCRILAHDSRPCADADYVPLGDLLRQSDIVTLHTPLTEETHHLLDRRRIGQMKHGAFVINTGRGPLLETEALVSALENGTLGGAALDVVEGEEGIFYADHRSKPIESESLLRLQSLPNVVISPHTAYYTDHALRDTIENSIINCVRFEGGTSMDRVKIGIIFGGCSEEHPVSVKSAQEVAKNLDTDKYEPYYVGITQSGAWMLCDGPGPNWEDGNCRPAVLSPDRTARGLLVQDKGRYETISLDLVLPVLHGKLGEDGAMQGLLELSGIPYVGCDIQSSALCMDKSLAYTVVKSAGIATPNFWTVTADKDADIDGLTYPCFVKPARSGSSFGVSKVSSKEELRSAVETARQYDSKVLIEEAVEGSEIGCAILGNDDDLIAGEVDQITLSHGFFKIHQESNPESGSENSTITVPADISAEARSLVQETAKAIYRALGCGGLARVDMFFTADGKVILNEVNTFPGMTSYSRYPRMMAAAGLPLAEVIDRLVSVTLTGKIQ